MTQIIPHVEDSMLFNTFGSLMSYTMGHFWPPVLLWLLGSSIVGWIGFFQIKRLHISKCKKRWLWIALSIGSGVFGFLFEKIIYSIPVPDDWYLYM